jgi:hypothetical protein
LLGAGVLTAWTPVSLKSGKKDGCRAISSMRDVNIGIGPMRQILMNFVKEDWIRIIFEIGWQKREFQFMYLMRNDGRCFIVIHGMPPAAMAL